MRPLSGDMGKIIATAELEIGQVEVPPGSNRGRRIDQYRPQWKRDELAKRDAKAGRTVQGDPYCAWFTTAMWHRALGRHPLGHQIGGCYALAIAARKRGLWLDLYAHQLDADMVIACYPGCAFVLLDQPLESGRSNGHTGIVSGVSEGGLTISTVEANSDNAVRAGQRLLRDPKMRGIVLTLGLEPLTGAWPRGLREGQDLAKLGTR